MTGRQFFPEHQADIEPIFGIDSPFPVGLVANHYEESPDGKRRLVMQKTYDLVETSSVEGKEA